ncbi:hypothetical protein PF005_g24476 [Phytophthora fragariae]|nr:hypothetical protein PF003_g19528 [Phytophthora fragariae]KAE8924524.1 hypothetical protein PF009_g25244 [Phytophthora fragariae]KAE8978712.1 hypothetical protein PF011_g23134 [Phytophthora fragariae]KAE9076459.1 hypothetical protein PF010_g23890 [Phytophthora fragariae]KAE9076819.1 hypothetical protein PF007_g24480 [Phytophthora fragariae]
MSSEQENAATEEERSKRTWNSSTKLVQPRRAARLTATSRGRTNGGPVNGSSGLKQTRRAASAGPTQQNRNSDHRVEEQENESEQQTLTRELLERAVSTAFGGLLQESTLDATAFPDHESQASELSSVRDKDNTPPIDSSATQIEASLRKTLEASTSLSVSHRQRRREHAEALQQATSDTRAAREFQRRMKHAAFEHRERKMAVQALQARIQREIQFLTATAADLEKREFLLNDAFETYERALRLELGLVDSACSTSKQKQVGASPKRSC